MDTPSSDLHLHTLTVEQIPHLGLDTAGQLVLRTAPTLSSHSSLPLEAQADLRMAIYWLTVYQPEPDATPLEQVQGYLDAAYHLSNLKAWPLVQQVLLKPLPSGKPLHEQLGIWGYYAEQIELYQHGLAGNFDSVIQSVCWGGLGYAYGRTGRLSQALACYQQQLTLADGLGDTPVACTVK